MFTLPCKKNTVFSKLSIRGERLCCCHSWAHEPLEIEVRLLTRNMVYSRLSSTLYFTVTHKKQQFDKGNNSNTGSKFCKITRENTIYMYWLPVQWPSVPLSKFLLVSECRSKTIYIMFSDDRRSKNQVMRTINAITIPVTFIQLIHEKLK